MRGENEQKKHSISAPVGSSPHARGKHSFAEALAATLRLIPACAGKTEPKDVLKDLLTGSSPHARGKRLGGGLRFSLQGLIPACAGKTCLVSGTAQRERAHPRMRGENTL